MGEICPKCRHDNPPDTLFCGRCATRLDGTGPSVSFTRTLETPATELGRGTIFAGRFEIIEELGAGGMGKVFRAYDKQVGEEVALKLLHPEIAVSKRTVDRFRNEIKLARKITHRNVCRMHELHQDGSTLFITMEYVAGQDLKGLIRQTGALTSGKTISIGRQVAEGLAEAHHLGVIHRDLKPQNIMVDKEGSAKVMDFGIARSLAGAGVTAEGTLIGTPEYMSPEQVEGKEADQRSDLYALGVILFEMATGRVPFEGDTPLSVAYKHKNEIPIPPRKLNSQVPEPLNRVILRCLEKDKADRYQTAEEFLADLALVEEGLPITERVAAKTRMTAQRSALSPRGLGRYLVPALAAFGVVALALVLWRTVFKPRPAERSIAVIHFLNQTGDTNFDYLRDAIPNLLVTSLEQSKFLQVTTFERLRDLLRQMGKTDVAMIDGDLGFELCRRDNVEVLVLGSYVKAGETFATDVKIFDARTRKMIKSFTARGTGAQSILDKQIAQLSREISRGVGLSKKAVDETKTLMAQAPTESIDAYKFYLSGHEKLGKIYLEEARKDLERAIGLDPRFALAYYDLRSVLFQEGDIAAARQALAKAKELSARASEKDRLYIEAQWAQSAEGDSEKRFRFLEEIGAKYPKEKDIHLALAGLYSNKKMFPQAFAEVDKGLALDPGWSAMLNQLGYVHIGQGDSVKAEEAFKKAIAAAPREPNAIDSLGDLYFRTGRLDAAIETYKRVIKVKPDHGSEEIIAYIEAIKGNFGEAMSWIDQFILMARTEDKKGRGSFWKAVFDYQSGRRGRAKAEMARFQGFAESMTTDNSALLSTALYGRALFYYDGGDYQNAVRCLSRGQQVIRDLYRSTKAAPLVEALMSFEGELLGGFVAVREGRLEAARRSVEAAAAVWPKSERARLGRDGVLEQALIRLRAEVLLLEGKPAESIALMEKEFQTLIPGFGMTPYLAVPLWLHFPLDQDVVPRAYEKMGDLDKAIEAYRKLITIDAKSRDRRMHNPVYDDRLAKLYEKGGRKAEAAEQYRRFLDLWKDADPGQPEVEDARKRLEGLK